MSKKNKKEKKTKLKKGFGHKEYIFNIISLVIIICIGLYYGGRSLYYYGDQNKKFVQTANTLNGLILSNNQLQTSGDGLYRNTDGYYFKGNVQNNYVWFGNRMFRIISLSEKDTVKLVSNDLVGAFMYGDSTDYQNSNLRNWLTNTEVDHAGVYYNTLPGNNKFLTKTNYTVDSIKDSKIVIGDKKYSDYVTSLTITDYNLAGGKNSFLNDGNTFYLIGKADEEEEVMFVDTDGSIQNCDPLEGFGIKAVITFKSNMEVTKGDGTVGNPFVINQGNDVNLVDSYVKLGNDLYKVFYFSGVYIKLYKVGYADNKNGPVIMPYSSSKSTFNANDKSSIGYYLNTTYYNNLPYKDYLLDSQFFTGETSDDTTHDFYNIYTSESIAKIGLLNIFDYVSCGELNDYFFLNTTSNVGDMQYVRHAGGVIEEFSVKTLAHYVPVITINSEILKAGDGTKDNPYVLG